MFLLLIAVVNDSYYDAKLNDLRDFNYEKCMIIYEIEILMPEYLSHYQITKNLPKNKLNL